MSIFLDARAADVVTIPVNTERKSPYVAWARYQSEAPDLDELAEWEARYPNAAAICGTISQRLLCIDIEGRFVATDRLKELAQRLTAAEIVDTWTTWVNGYCETTPSGGLHILVRLSGDGPMPHNDKLAFDGGGQVVIETRAEARSNGRSFLAANSE